MKSSRLRIIRVYICIFIYSFFTSPLLGQSVIESIKQDLQTAHDTSKVQLYNALSYALLLESSEDALHYAFQAIELSERLGDMQGKAAALMNIATYYKLTGNSQTAITYYIRSYFIYSNLRLNKKSIDALFKISDSYRSISKHDRALEYYQKAYDIAEKLNDSLIMANVYAQKGKLFLEISNYDKALNNFFEALRLFESMKRDSNIAEILHEIGQLYYRIESYNRAIEYYQRAYAIYKERADKSGLMMPLRKIGDIYLLQNQFIQAEENYNELLQLAKETRDTIQIAYTLNSFGMLNLKRQRLKISLEYFQMAVMIMDSLNNAQGEALIETNTANLYIKQKNYTVAKKHLDKALEKAELARDRHQFVQVLNQLGEISLLLHDYEMAHQYYLEALTEAQKVGMDALRQNIYLQLTELYDHQEQYDKSLFFYKKYIGLKDSLFNVQINEKLVNLELNYETEKQEKEKTLLRQNKELEIQKHRNTRNFLVVIFSLLVILSIVLYTRYQSKIKSETALQELNATKDKFFSIIAHDLKNPFHNLIGLSEVLIEDIDEYDHESIKEVLELILESSSKGYYLLENLLEWSRSQTDRIRYAPQKINLTETTDESIELLYEIADNKKITLINRLDSNFEAYADENMIKTVIRNLVSNAIKFTNTMGTVKIYATESGNNYIYSVEDNGIGIDDENIEKLFKIDVSFSSHGTKGETGTGLGLILCKEFVEKNNGKIWLESEVNKGSIFNFTVPKYNGQASIEQTT